MNRNFDLRHTFKILYTTQFNDGTISQNKFHCVKQTKTLELILGFRETMASQLSMSRFIFDREVHLPRGLTISKEALEVFSQILLCLHFKSMM